ncbi:hypothetical protein ES705_23167 [subsurface metagenome]
MCRFRRRSCVYCSAPATASGVITQFLPGLLVLNCRRRISLSQIVVLEAAWVGTFCRSGVDGSDLAAIIAGLQQKLPVSGGLQPDPIGQHLPVGRKRRRAHTGFTDDGNYVTY